VRSFFSRSRFSHSRATAKARSGSAPRASSTDSSISATRASSSKAKPSRFAGSTSARRRSSPPSARIGVRFWKTGSRGLCSWQRMRKSSRSDSSTWTSPSLTRRPRSSAKRSCTSFGLSVNSSSSWSTTRTASRWLSRHFRTIEKATSGLSKPRSCFIVSASEGSTSTRAWASERIGAPPGVETMAPQPEGREAISPARTNEVFPAPEGPMRARSLL
jgi:hypothetical protein